MAAQVKLPSLSVPTYSYKGYSYRVFLWLPKWQAIIAMYQAEKGFP